MTDRSRFAETQYEFTEGSGIQIIRSGIGSRGPTCCCSCVTTQLSTCRRVLPARSGSTSALGNLVHAKRQVAPAARTARGVPLQPTICVHEIQHALGATPHPTSHSNSGFYLICAFKTRESAWAPPLHPDANPVTLVQLVSPPTTRANSVLISVLTVSRLSASLGMDLFIAKPPPQRRSNRRYCTAIDA